MSSEERSKTPFPLTALVLFTLVGIGVGTLLYMNHHAVESQKNWDAYMEFMYECGREKNRYNLSIDCEQVYIAILEEREQMEKLKKKHGIN